MGMGRRLRRRLNQQHLFCGLNGHVAVGRKAPRPMTTGHVRTAPTLVSSRRIAALGLLASFLALLVTPARAAAGTPERVSVDSAGNEGNGGSGGPVISADGRFVAF